MCRNTKVDNRIQHHILRSNNFLRKPNTSNNRTVERRSRIICHQHGSNGSITLSESTHRFTEHQQSKHQDTHRFIEWQKHCNKDRNRKENKARWIETSIYTTTGSTQSFAHHQNTHQRQSGRYLYQVHFSRNTATSPTQCWTAHPTLSTRKLLTKQHTMFHKLLKQTVNAPCAHLTHIKGARWAMRHFNMEYFNNIFFASEIVNFQHAWSTCRFSRFLSTWCLRQHGLCNFAFNMFCCDFCFSGSTFCWTTVVTSDENVNMKRWTTIECSTEAVLFQQCLAFNVFLTNNKNYGSKHYGSTTNSC